MVSELPGSFLWQSIVHITINNHRASGFFVAQDTILTCFHIFKDTQKELIKIYHDNRECKILNSETYPNIDIAIIRIEIDEDRERSCLELDPDYQLDDEFCIYQNLLKQVKSIKLKFLDRNNLHSGRITLFTNENIESNLNGSPLINLRTGKVVGIVSLQSPKSSHDHIKENTVYAISVAAILKEFPDRIQKLNYNFHHNLSNLPRRSYQDFVGRETAISQLLEYISPSYRQHIIVVDGIAGIGKTSLVVKAAYRCLLAKQIDPSYFKNIKPPIFDAIIFTSSRKDRIFSRDFASSKDDVPNFNLLFIVRTIANTLKAPELNRFHEKERFDLIYEYLGKQSTLLIVDGLNDIGSDESTQILEFLNNLPNSTKVIITTRQQSLFHSHVSLKSLSEKETAQFIREQAQLKEITISSDKIKQISSSLRGVPIALIYAIGQYTSRYSTDTIIPEPPMSIHDDIGKFCFDRTVTSIENSAEYYLLMSLAFFADEACREALVSVAGLEADNLAIDNALVNLQKLSLVSEYVVNSGKKYYSVLPATREYTLEKLATLSETNPNFEIEARFRWVNWYLNFVKEYDDQRLETELANIEEVLFWSASKEDYNTVKEIWDSIDAFIKKKEYWAIRFYWWQYLETESRKHSEQTTYIKALLEKAFTWIKIDAKHCEEANICFEEANVCLKKKTIFNKSDLEKLEDLTRLYIDLSNLSCGYSPVRV
jgi:Trypsin-like peptidase domain/NB-ARC domain